ncbi:MAG: hypothetical protein ACK5L3_04305 [Oscillospiraceae bacterium]
MSNAKITLKEKWGRFFLLVFAAVFLCIFLQIVFFNSSFGYSVFIQGALLVVWLVFFALAAFWGYKNRPLLYAHRYKILLLVLLFVFCVQVWVGIVTKQQVNHDYGKVFNGAVMFATQGDVEEFYIYEAYLHHFTNNVGEFLFLQLLFKGMYAIGLPYYYEAAILLGHIFFTLAILFTFLYLNKAFGPGAALLSLFFYVFYLPVYFQSSIAYTDTYSIWMPALLLYCHKCAAGAARWKKILLYVAIGAILALGVQIKGTVLITGIALVIEELCAARWKRLVAMVLLAALSFGAFNGAINAYAYATILQAERVESDSMPITHWLMTGLTGDGAYNPTDEWVITSSVAGQQARTKLNLEIIKGRLTQMGPIGYLQLLHRKTCRTFGSGNGEVNYLLVREPNNPNHFIYQIISTEGKFFRYFDNLSHCVYLSFYIFSIAGVAVALKKKNRAFTNNTAPFLALTGFYFFMMLWESNHRLLVNQWPLFIIAAAAGAGALLPKIYTRLPARKAKQKQPL